MKAATPSSYAVMDESAPKLNGQRSDYLVTEQPVRDAPRAPANLVLRQDWIAGEDSSKSVRVSISGADGASIASALVTPAEDSTLIQRVGLPGQALSQCVLVSDVALEPGSGADVLGALIYLCARRGRIWDRPMVTVGLAAEMSAKSGETAVGFEPLPKIKAFHANGRSWALFAQRLDMAIHQAWTSASPALQVALREQFVAETVETLERWIERFFKTSWFRSVYEGTMTREQYVYTLSNLHQFVRWTTRHIGRAVSCSNDRAIRNKWLEHIQGEINHELIIEKDLAALGADVDYVVDSMLPNVSNLQFIVTQESMVAFHADPVLIMAGPFVAEGFTGKLDQKFIEALRNTAKSWGVENPKQVTAFLASHIEFDGGDDGHWDQTRRMLGKYLITETDLLRFLNVIRLCMRSFELSYSSYVDELAIFSAIPTNGAA